jgi:multiple sugar transport system substrate-binding protein
MNHLRGSGVPFDIAPLPALRTDATILMTIGAAISTRSESIAAARTFADYLLSGEAQMELRTRTLSIPAVPSAAEWEGEETIYRPPGFLLFREQVSFMRLFTDIGLSVEQMDAVIKEARLYWAKLQNEDGMRSKLADILQSG